jgi:methylase of polypeptide subunit release factors
VNDDSLVELLHYLRHHGYRFATVTPATHSIVVARPLARKPDLRDIFGWNRSFSEDDLEPAVCVLLERAGAIETGQTGELRSLVRVASLGEDLIAHSAFPTDEPDSVFFGPDTYRFVRFVQRHTTSLEAVGALVDMGAGSGAGGIATVRGLRTSELTLVDVNPKANRYARINAAAAGLRVETVQSDRVPEFDLLIGNAPYLMDTSERVYRHGGDLFGGAVSLDWVRQGLERLRQGRKILLYTAAAYVDGQSPLLTEIEEECRAARAALCIEEIDADVFGNELTEPGYGKVERIAAVGIRIG